MGIQLLIRSCLYLTKQPSSTRGGISLLHMALHNLSSLIRVLCKQTSIHSRASVHRAAGLGSRYTGISSYI